jgi:hypothetical protein
LGSYERPRKVPSATARLNAAELIEELSREVTDMFGPFGGVASARAPSTPTGPGHPGLPLPRPTLPGLFEVTEHDHGSERGGATSAARRTRACGSLVEPGWSR